TKQDHVLRVALGPTGMLYAGTDKGGLIYRIDSKGKGFVLYQTAQSEVRSLLVTPTALYAGTSSPTRGRLAGSGTLTSSSSGTLGGGGSDGAKGSPASSSPPSTGDNSLYRIAADGTVKEIFREKALMLCLLRQNGKMLIGTGMQGQLFEIDE